MKTHIDYLDEACKYLDRLTEKTTSPSQLQTINLALVMAIADLIKAIEQKS